VYNPVFRDILLGERPYRKRNPILDHDPLTEHDCNDESVDTTLEIRVLNKKEPKRTERELSKKGVLNNE
jgi:hypothetical protein